MKNDIKKPRLFISSRKGVYSKIYDDIYFDKFNPIKEKEYVYLKANDLLNRFKLSNKFCIAELGFGTGLNFVLTWSLWKKYRKPNSFLTYVSFENAPMSKKEMKRVYKKFSKLSIFSNQLIKKLTHTYKTNRTIHFQSDNINLILVYDNFSSLTNFNFKADAWFLDGFTPKKNPDAWDDNYFKQIYNLTNFKGTISTYTVSGFVRRGLTNAGFQVSRIKGFGKKKEMLTASKAEPINDLKPQTISYNNIGPVAIIGAGISGASLAYALRKRNIECFILDKSSKIAGGASGNKLALQMPKMTADDSPYGILSLEAFSFSRNLAKELKATPRSHGLVILPKREREIVKYKKLIKNKWPRDLIHNHTDKVNIFNLSNYIYMNSSGIVDNIKFIKNLIKDTNIFYNFNVKKIQTIKNDHKILIDSHGTRIKARTIIWANGFDMSKLSDLVPIKPVSGQVTYLKNDSLYQNLRLNFSYGQFFSQLFKGCHQIGSSFNQNTNVDYKEIDQINNLNSIPDFLKKKVKCSHLDRTEYRVSVRASTKDRMPFFCNINDITEQKTINEYALGGMGAWGFVYAPYYAELLIREILEEKPLVNLKLDSLLRIKRLL
ncbi:MAG: tRNA (5-methylaminomethyl-2-thiouridine)(34)-methyltransferase MnmD [Alphaproteobacteria bacterium]|nr:tRNA (5-methylaminomethyl-2-thiouridine)(34)-methyltransferase MnmD [Alphaproteobacteria bacterium]